MTPTTCPYCRHDIVEPDITETCPSCEALHHSECWIENGGCAVIGCAALADSPGQAKIVITEDDLEASSESGPGRTARFVVPQVGKALVITAILLIGLAIAAAFYLRNATQQEEGPVIEWGTPNSKQAP